MAQGIERLPRRKRRLCEGFRLRILEEEPRTVLPFSREDASTALDGPRRRCEPHPRPQMAQTVGNRYTKNPVFNRSQNRRERSVDAACHTNLSLLILFAGSISSGLKDSRFVCAEQQTDERDRSIFQAAPSSFSEDHIPAYDLFGCALHLSHLGAQTFCKPPINSPTSLHRCAATHVSKEQFTRRFAALRCVARPWD
jgi:hypothetical protein